MKVLLIRPDAIGDMILLTPTFSLLKRGMPDARVTVLARAYTRPLLSGNSDVDEVLTEPKVKRGDFDAILHAYNEFPYAWLGFWNRIKYRVADKSKLLFSFLNNVDAKQRFGDLRYHEAEHNLFLAYALFDKLGIKKPDDFEPETKIPVSDKPLPFQVQGDLIGIHPGTGKGNRAWPAEKYARLIDLICERHANVQVVLTGSAGEQENNRKIIDLCQVKPVSIAGQTDLETLIALISKMKCFISVDTGPMHIAAALKIPVVAISPVKYVKPTRWGPYRTDQVIIRNTSFCNLRCNPYKCDSNECMNAITEQMVFEGVERVLSGRAVPAKDFKSYHIRKSANIMIYDDTKSREGKKYYEILSRADYSVYYLTRMPGLDFIPKNDINIIHVFSRRARLFFKLLRPFVSPFLSNPPVIFMGEKVRMDSGKDIVDTYLNYGN